MCVCHYGFPKKFNLSYRFPKGAQKRMLKFILVKF